MQAVIIGGGPVGLAAAHGLIASGAHVTVLEAGPQLRPQGSGLTLFGNGVAALKSLGLSDALSRLTGDVAPALGGIREPGGDWLARTPGTALWNLRAVHRESLHTILLGELPAGTVCFETSAEVASTSQGLVAPDAGDEVRADLVVVADGIRSRSRRHVTADPGARSAGYGAWRGVTHGKVPGVVPSETWGAGRRFGLVPLTDGRVYWFAVTGTNPDPSHEDQRSLVLDLFGDWHEPIAEVVRQSDPGVVSWLPIEELARPLGTFTRGRVVLVGDAAHAMTPNLGQGANQGLEDAATLCALLRESSDLAEVLARYDAVRRPRTHRIARRSRLLGTVGQLRHPALVRARDALMRATPTAVAGRQFREFESWEPSR